MENSMENMYTDVGVQNVEGVLFMRYDSSEPVKGAHTSWVLFQFNEFLFLLVLSSCIGSRGLSCRIWSGKG